MNDRGGRFFPNFLVTLIVDSDCIVRINARRLGNLTQRPLGEWALCLDGLLDHFVESFFAYGARHGYSPFNPRVQTPFMSFWS